MAQHMGANLSHSVSTQHYSMVLSIPKCPDTSGTYARFVMHCCWEDIRAGLQSALHRRLRLLHMQQNVLPAGSEHCELKSSVAWHPLSESTLERGETSAIQYYYPRHFDRTHFFLAHLSKVQISAIKYCAWQNNKFATDLLHFKGPRSPIENCIWPRRRHCANEGLGNNRRFCKIKINFFFFTIFIGSGPSRPFVVMAMQSRKEVSIQLENHKLIFIEVVWFSKQFVWYIFQNCSVDPVNEQMMDHVCGFFSVHSNEIIAQRNLYETEKREQILFS